MYDYIQISKINDFLFCPHSLYFHSVYENFESKNYNAKPQIAGKLAHKSIDERYYSSRNNILQGTEVFSERYGIIGKIDIYNTRTKELVERKKKIKNIYDGYLFQLYAQKMCLEEMGYDVRKMSLHSMTDNKTYSVTLKNKKIKEFNETLEKMRKFDLATAKCTNIKKCSSCIYHELCRK